jgi:hypothetical protein
MASVQEFIEARTSIETLIKQITLATGQKPTQESKRGLDEANRQLEILKTMVGNDVQVVVAGRLSRALTTVGTRIETMLAKMPTKRKKATAKKAATVL